MVAPPWLTITVSVLVATAWGSALVIGAIERDWTALTITTPCFMLLLGYVFGVQIIKKNGNGHS